MVWILDFQCILLTIVDAKGKFFKLLQYRSKLWGSFCLAGFDCVHGNHSLVLLLFDFPCLGPFGVRGWVCCSIVRLFKSHFVLYLLNWTKVSVLHVLQLCKLVMTFVTPSELFFRWNYMFAPRGLRNFVWLYYCTVASKLLVAFLRLLIDTRINL